MPRTGPHRPAPEANGFGAAGSAVRAAVGSEYTDRTAVGSWHEGLLWYPVTDAEQY